MTDTYASLQGRRVLVVDDSAPITSLVDDVLSECGAEVVCRNDAQAGLDEARSHRFDLLILDVRMPGMSGWSFLDELEADEPGIRERTILLTGDKYRLDKDSPAEHADIRTLFKPFDLNELRRVSDEILRETASSGTG